MLAHYAPLFFRWKLRGDHKRSPFFGGEPLAPVVMAGTLERALAE